MNSFHSLPHSLELVWRRSPGIVRDSTYYYCDGKWMRMSRHWYRNLTAPGVRVTRDMLPIVSC